MKQRTVLSALGAAAALAALVPTLTSCSLPRTDVATIVYKVSVTPSTQLDKTKISYLHTPDPEKSATPEDRQADLSDPEYSSSNGDWARPGAIVGKETAKVAATPPAGATARCEILLDGKKVLAKNQGRPGESVECEVKTPPREPGVLKDLGLD